MRLYIHVKGMCRDDVQTLLLMLFFCYLCYLFDVYLYDEGFIEVVYDVR